MYVYIIEYMTDTKLVRLDIDAYNILNRTKVRMNAEKKKRGQSENATFSDAVRFLAEKKSAVT